ncbi:CD209 antigen-like protein C [Sparus aurata]|uniref:CD209 antigen-like protein C n=1 Tax=Sparus aurata TaxID=8175 RepID=A0A671TJ03_SPAAU|nr:CD209 antigen-like protein C [Sparus aurata]
MVVDKGESEITIEIVNLPDTSARRSHTGEGGEVTTAATGGKLLGCIAVSFCLMCILQASLNICLRLALSSPPDIDCNCKNLTDERDNLRRINLDIEERYKILTEERDKLRRVLNDSALQLNSQAEEGGKLESQLNVLKHYLQQGWFSFSDSVYYISSTKKTWQDSRNDCLQRAADLVIIGSTEEQDFIKQHQKIMWIGLTDREMEGMWKWVDGSPLTTSLWDSGEPNSAGGNEDCVVMNSFKNVNSWNDERCENENFWMCEKKITL